MLNLPCFSVLTVIKPGGVWPRPGPL